MLQVFIGFDKKEIAAYQVCAYSIIRNSSVPVSITPLNIQHFPWFSNTDYKASTDFAFTRFLVPWLSEYKGWSLFLDGDMLVKGDINDLFECKDDRFAVQCVQHDYSPVMGKKFLNAEQTDYSRKNWSSVMLFNNAKCEVLTPGYVNTTGGLDLHQMAWAKGTEVGSLPKSWNHLVGEEYGQFTDPELIRWTRGGPYFEAFEHEPYAQVWHQYHAEANSVLDTKIVEAVNV